MHFDGWTFALQGANFLVLVWLLRRFLYRPILALVAARRSEIETQYQQGEALKSEAQKELASAAAARASLESERDVLCKRAADEAAGIIAHARAQAQREGTALIEDARKKIAAERATALAEAPRLATDLGCDLARQLLGALPAGVRAHGWLERLLGYLAALPAPERERLLHSLSAAGRAIAADPTVCVKTADPLSEGDRERCRTELRALLGQALTIDFGVDPALIAGVEMHLPNAIVRLSWRDTLERVRSELPSTGAPVHAIAR